MKFIAQRLHGVHLIAPDPFIDGRGTFWRQFCDGEFARHGVVATPRQISISENIERHTLRGIHHQAAPHAEAKTLSCLAGAIYDIVVDLRPDSPTYLKWISIEISAVDRTSVHIPAGCAHGYLTLAPHTVVQYLCSEPYAPESAQGIRYNDPYFGFRWPHEPSVISEKDKNYADFVVRA